MSENNRSKRWCNNKKQDETSAARAVRDILSYHDRLTNKLQSMVARLAPLYSFSSHCLYVVSYAIGIEQLDLLWLGRRRYHVFGLYFFFFFLFSRITSLFISAQFPHSSQHRRRATIPYVLRTHHIGTNVDKAGY